MISEVETYKPFPRQQVFHSSPAKYRLFGGAAGPGKSRSLLEEAVMQALEIDGCDTLVMRRTFAELEESIILPFRRDIPWKAMGGKYNESKHVCVWPNGSTTRFGFCRRENDVYQYQGGQFVFIGIDELTLFTLKQWQFLTSRNRCPVKVYSHGPNQGRPVLACMAGASNPGNIGHAWVKALFVDRRPAPGMDHPERYDASDYDFIPAKIDDNPIYANDENYRKTLEDLPEALRQAFLEGNWNIFAGQYFDIFDVGRHCAEPEEWDRQEWIPGWAPLWISIDWGFEHWAAVYWHAQVGEKTRTYRELVVKHRAPVQLAEAIVEAMNTPNRWFMKNGRHDADQERERIKDVYLSAEAISNKHSWGENSVADLMDDVLIDAKLPRCTPADNDRVGGWMLMYQMMQNDLWEIAGPSSPTLRQAEDGCPRLIASIPMMTRDPDHLEDCLKVDGDDPADSVRYGLKSKLSPGRKPVAVRVAERMSDLMKKPEFPKDNITGQMMIQAAIEKQERKKFKPVRFFGPKRGGFHR
jgi:phage terminase large subunit